MRAASVRHYNVSLFRVPSTRNALVVSTIARNLNTIMVATIFPRLCRPNGAIEVSWDFRIDRGRSYRVAKKNGKQVTDAPTFRVGEPASPPSNPIQPSLLRYPASIDNQRGPDGELCVLGTEIEDRSSDFFGNTFSANRNHRSNLIAHGAVSETIEHIGGDHSRRDGVDADVSPGEFECDRFGQAFDSMLGSDVNADLPQTNVPGHTGIVDYGAVAIREHGGNFVTH